MSELSTLARPYAAAAFKSAKETGNASVWSDSLTFVSEIAKSDELSAAAHNPKVGKDKLIGLIMDICQDYVHAEAKNLVKILIENDKFSIVPQVAELFEKYRADDEGYVNVDVVTAYPLSGSEQVAYVSSLEKQLNKKVHATVSVDQSLIGGILAKAGDKVIDGSIKGQLHQLAKKL